MNKFGELVEAAYMNSGRRKLQKWMALTVFLMRLYTWDTEEKREILFQYANMQ